MNADEVSQASDGFLIMLTIRKRRVPAQNISVRLITQPSYADAHR
jgi:hypothetical protein